MTSTPAKPTATASQRPRPHRLPQNQCAPQGGEQRHGEGQRRGFRQRYETERHHPQGEAGESGQAASHVKPGATGPQHTESRAQQPRTDEEQSEGTAQEYGLEGMQFAGHVTQHAVHDREAEHRHRHPQPTAQGGGKRARAPVLWLVRGHGLRIVSPGRTHSKSRQNRVKIVSESKHSQSNHSESAPAIRANSSLARSRPSGVPAGRQFLAFALVLQHTWPAQWEDERSSIRDGRSRGALTQAQRHDRPRRRWPTSSSRW